MIPFPGNAVKSMTQYNLKKQDKPKGAQIELNEQGSHNDTQKIAQQGKEPVSNEKVQSNTPRPS